MAGEDDDIASSVFVKSAENYAEQPIHFTVAELCAQELNSLSTEERDLCFNEVHGVDRIYTETPEFLSKCLAALDRALLEEIRQRKEAYFQALRLSNDYVQGRKFRLAFLRAERFRADKAALRMVQFLDWKLRTFGPEKLTEPILFNDLGEETQDALQSGCFQLLPSRDRSGRVVLCCDFQAIDQQYRSHMLHQDPSSLIATAFSYILLTAAEDEESQRRGMVVVFYQVERSSGAGRRRARSVTYDHGTSGDSQWDFTLARTPDDGGGFRTREHHSAQEKLSKVLEWAPIRTCGAHFCWEDPRLTPVVHSMLANAARDIRLRARLHHKQHSHMTAFLNSPHRAEEYDCANIADCDERRDDLRNDNSVENNRFKLAKEQLTPSASSLLSTFLAPQQISRGTHGLSQLKTFGIPVESLPVTVDGILKTSSHNDWLAKRKLMEGRISQFPNFALGDGAIALPSKFDVVFGRGKPFQQHVGNLVLRALVDEHMVEYITAPYRCKWTVCQKVLNAIREHSGGRFLRKDQDGLWRTISDTEARDKVSKTFLSLTTKIKKMDKMKLGIGIAGQN